MGSTIALTRAMLDEIGGFMAFADYLADDYEMGRAVRARGHALAIPAMGVGHTATEAVARGTCSAMNCAGPAPSARVNPLGHLGSIVTFAFPLGADGRASAGFFLGQRWRCWRLRLARGCF